MKVVATTRKVQGSGASRRLRREGKVPGIIYGGSNEPTSVSIDHNPLYHALRVEEFHSSILDMELDGKGEQVLLRDVQWHAYKPQVMHVDFQRVDANKAITVFVPLHFKNEENSPAVKTDKAVVNHVLNELEVSCLPKDLPKFIEVDLGELTMDAPVHLSNVKLPSGVEIITHGDEDPVIATAAVVEEEPEPEAPVAEAAPAADAKKGAAPASGGDKKAAAPAADAKKPAGDAKK